MLLVRKLTLSNLTGARSANHNQDAVAPTNNADKGWVGPITLRRRAKPELENERHKDVSLRISIQEVKNLTVKGRYFCEIRLDRTLYARTTSKSSDGTVFWGEKFDLNNLPSISVVTINLFRQATSMRGNRRQSTKSQNQFIAYITIPLADEAQESEIQQWYTMQTPQPSPQFICLDNLYRQLQPLTTKENNNQASRLRKCSTPVNSLRYLNDGNIIIAKPQIDDSRLSTGSRKKASWAAGDGQSQLLEQIKQCSSPMPSPTSPSSSNLNGSTTSSIENNNNNNNNSLPQLRLNIHYQTTIILPIQCYHKLKEFIRLNYLNVIKLLEPKLATKQKEELASCFVNIFEKLPDFSITEFLANLLKEDLINNNTSNKECMIFRSNSTCSKAVECYVKLIGNDYLQYLLANMTDQLLTIEDEFELDPARFCNVDGTCSNATSSSSATAATTAALTSKLEKNLNSLIKYVTTIWYRIESSMNKLPRELYEVFVTLATIVKEHCGPQTAANLTSSCLFLRYICPAIHGPVLFGLASSIPENKRISRNLTLIAKVLQNLANLTLFEEKESHMKPLNKFLEKEIPKMHTFLQTISSESGTDLIGPTDSKCHEFIDLGYEFSKIANILNSHLNDLIVDEQLVELPDILKLLNDLTDDEYFYSWNADHLVSNEKISNQKNNTTDFTTAYTNNNNNNKSLQNTGQTNEQQFNIDKIQIHQQNGLQPTSYKQQNHTLCKQSYYVNEPYSSNNALQPLADELYTMCNLKQTRPNLCYSTDNNDHHLTEHPDLSADNNNNNSMDELLHRYREQLKQLNDCIGQVDRHQFPTQSEPVYLKNINQGVDSSPNNLSYLNTLGNGVKMNCQLLIHSPNENRLKQTDIQSPIVLHHRTNQQTNNTTNNNNNGNNNNYSHTNEKHYQNLNQLHRCGSNQLPRIIKVVHKDISNSPGLLSIASNTDITSDSEYDFDDDVVAGAVEMERKTGQDVINSCNSSSSSSHNTFNQSNHKQQTHNEIGLSESPSLDQLAERLQELKQMLQLERQEIEEVVASKTQAIQQQEKSIQQLECELDQLRREHQPHIRSSSSSSSHYRYTGTSRSTSRTVSPTSSFSSDFYSSNLSDITQSYLPINNNINNNNNHKKKHKNNLSPIHLIYSNGSNYYNQNNNTNTTTTNNNNNNYVQINKNNMTDINSLMDLRQMHNRRTQSFREKIYKHSQPQLQSHDFRLRGDANLLYLTGTGECTGIPLSHLIEPNRPKQVRRRLSESKLSPN